MNRGSIYKRKDGRWELRISLGKNGNGRRIFRSFYGKTIEEAEFNRTVFDVNNVKQALNTFIGKQEQMPPMYSAIKVNGKKLYEYARQGVKVEVKPRQIEIYEIELLKIEEDKKQIELKVSCSKGTYIRSLCEDIAKKLGTIGYMVELERLQVGDFTLKQSVKIDELENEGIEKAYIPMEKLFEKKDMITLQEHEYKMFLNGVQLTRKDKQDDVYRIYVENKFIRNRSNKK